MKKNRRSRGIIYLNNEQILLIHRIRDNHNYYVFPGGGLEGEETYEDAIIRETQEEMSISVKVHKMLYHFESSKDIQKFYLCTISEGEIGIGVGPEFTSEKYFDRGKYIPIKMAIKDIKNFNIIPKEIIENLTLDLRNKSIFEIDSKKIIIEDYNE